MKKYTFFAFVCCLFALRAAAQFNLNQNKKWVFGRHAGLNFSSGSPVSFPTNIYTNEGCASVSDASGNLLFYTNGKTVYNRTGAVMPSGSSIVPFDVWSTSQAAVIAPVYGNPSQYYVFSLESWTPGPSAYCRLAWCIIDMTLDGGYGDVLGATGSTPLADLLTEKMIIIPGNSCDLWLLTHRRDSAIFQAYNINGAGINSIPVKSVLGPNTGNMMGGVMKVSPDRSKIIYQYMHYPSGGGGSELYDFNPNTGVVSNCRMLDTTHSHYGAEFSPDNTKVYSGRIEPDTPSSHTIISQFDVTLPSASAIIGSRVDIRTVGGNFPPDMRLAPNGKIYFTSIPGGFSDSIDCIANPNLSGLSCSYIHRAIGLAGDTTGFSMGSEYWVPTGTPTFTYSHHDTSVCIPPADSVTIHPAFAGTSYHWFDGSNSPQHRVGLYGTYWVKVVNGCSIMVDTIKVLPTTSLSNTHTDTFVCIPSTTPITIYPGAIGLSYVWYDGVTTHGHSVATYGSYWVQISNGCAVRIDTVHVIPAYDSLFNRFDTAICSHTSGDVWAISVTLRAGAGTSYNWSDGSGADTTIINGPGAYWVSYVSDCHFITDTFYVTYNYLHPIVGPDTVCESNTATFYSATVGSIWSVNPATIATISSAGVLSGVAPGTAIITLSVVPGCDTTKTIFVQGSPCDVGIGSLSTMDNVQIYPNPLTGTLNIESTELISEISLTNCLGQVIYAHKFNAHSLRVSLADVPEGFYLLRINGLVSGRIQKR